MNVMLAGNLKSKTSWAAILLMALGGLEQSGLLALVPDEYKGVAISAIGGLMLFLRNVTAASIADKAAVPVANKQGGFARPLFLALIASLTLIAITITGCASTSPQSQLILETTTRIAVRRALESDRAIEKARNIREVAQTLQGLVTAESTIAGLRDTVLAEIDKLELAPVDKADATDLVNLFAAILEERYGDEIAGDERMVKVREFLDIVLRTLPAV